MDTADGRADLPVGFMDTGVGGIAMLKTAVELLPQEDFIFYGDIGNAPYGSREDDEIRSLTMRAFDHLYSMGVKAIVVACNTMTSASIEDIRRKYEDIPVLGTEPAVKPACEELPGGRIAVMATPATLRMRRFQEHLQHYCNEASIISVPCPGLSRLIEERGPEGRAVQDYLKELFKTYLADGVDGVVVGCTHYIFIEKLIRRFSGAQKIFDGVLGTVRHLKNRLEGEGLLKPAGMSGFVRMVATPGSEEELPLFEKFYSMKNPG